MGKFLIPVSLDDSVAHQLGLQDFSAERMPYANAQNQRRWVTKFDYATGLTNGYQHRLIFTNPGNSKISIHNLYCVFNASYSSNYPIYLVSNRGNPTAVKNPLNFPDLDWQPEAGSKILFRFATIVTASVWQRATLKFDTPLVTGNGEHLYLYTLMGPLFECSSNIDISFQN